jgi:hypothetical protein
VKRLAGQSASLSGDRKEETAIAGFQAMTAQVDPSQSTANKQQLRTTRLGEE